MASETVHCGQKLMRCEVDFCRGRMPTVCANMYTETDLSPASISRLQRMQKRFSTHAPRSDTAQARYWDESRLCIKCAAWFPSRGWLIRGREPFFALVIP